MTRSERMNEWKKKNYFRDAEIQFMHQLIYVAISSVRIFFSFVFACCFCMTWNQPLANNRGNRKHLKVKI